MNHDKILEGLAGVAGDDTPRVGTFIVGDPWGPQTPIEGDVLVVYGRPHTLEQGWYIERYVWTLTEEYGWEWVRMKPPGSERSRPRTILV